VLSHLTFALSWFTGSTKLKPTPQLASMWGLSSGFAVACCVVCLNAAVVQTCPCSCGVDIMHNLCSNSVAVTTSCVCDPGCVIWRTSGSTMETQPALLTACVRYVSCWLNPPPPPHGLMCCCASLLATSVPGAHLGFWFLRTLRL
jgi:hypothetical protein